MNREYHKWNSLALGREMELLVFGHAGKRLLVFPTRQQRFFEYEDRGMVHSLRHRIEAGEWQLYCVDGVDDESLYAFDKPPEERIRRHLQYENYILKEVLPFAEERNPGQPTVAHGCSLGAYHAVSIALRHPRYFQRVLGFSGRYDLTIQVEEFFSLFHGYDSEELNQITPNRLVPGLRSDNLRRLRRIPFILAVGEEDPFCPNNLALIQALAAKKIPAQLHQWVGNAHRFRYWRQMVRIYL